MPGTAENERMRKMLTEMLAQLEAESAARSQQEGSSQAAFADALDRRILGDEEADADAVMRRRDQSRAQLPTERQAFAAGTDNGTSRDELANYAMIKRAQRGGRALTPSEQAAPVDDAAGFEKDFASDQRMRSRMTDMFGSRSRVPEAERRRILSEMAKGANAQMAATAGAPPSAGAPGFNPALSEPDLDEAALRERGMR